MSAEKNRLTGILLAGGRSKRMGREKGALSIGGHRLFEYPLSVLNAVCSEVIISSSGSKDLSFDHPVVNDEIEGLGPIGGILTCLKYSSTELNLVLSYDMPLVNKGLIRYLVDQSEGWDMVIPALNHAQPEPLCALYRKRMIPHFQELVDKKQYAVHRVMSMTQHLIVHVEPGMPFYHPELFLNVNLQSDLDRIPGELNNEE